MAAKKSFQKPRAPDAESCERALIGAVLADPERVWPIVSRRGLGVDHFTDAEARAAWGAITRLSAAGSPIDGVTVQAESGLAFSALESMLDCGLPAHAEFFADQIQNAALQRAALATIRQHGGSPEGLRLALRQIEEVLPTDTSGGGAVDAADWIDSDPPPPEYILLATLELLARGLLVGSSKTKKSFLALQMAICCAACAPFLGIPTARAFRVLLVNLENQAEWQHRRLRCMCRTLGITRERLADRLVILNGRGRGVTLRQIEEAARSHRAELVILDPLYKLDGGADECDMAERKRLVGELEGMGHRLQAALVVVHHDPKGAAGEKNIRDRGAGSSVINRDVDCTLAISQFSESHPEAENMAVLSVLARNSPPHGDMTLVFRDGAFHHLPDVAPMKATARTRSATPTFNADAALALVSVRPMTRMHYRDAIRSYGGTRDGREAWITKSLADGQLIEQRHGQREKLIGTPRAFELMKPLHTSDIYEGRET